MLGSIEDVIIKSSEFTLLANEIEQGKIAKTIMLISEDKDYSFEFAKFLSCMILNGGLENGKIEQNDNYFKVLASSHPDVKLFPAKDKLLVADSEAIVEESFVRPIFADRKVFIIKNIEDSMEAAQNKLLKTLEEPQSNIYFILTTSNINLVLPTIRSRCNKIELGKLSKDKICNLLGENKNISLICTLCEGYIGKAENLSQMDDLEELFNSVTQLVTKLKSSKQLLSFSKALSPYLDRTTLIFQILSLIFEDILFIKSGKENKFSWIRGELEEASKEYTFTALIEIEKLLNKAEKELVFNCNLILVIENLLLNILEVKYLCK